MSAGNISAVQFSLVEANKTTVILNITDPVTSFHHQGRQLTIRDILKKDLKYKIVYYKDGSTREASCKMKQLFVCLIALFKNLFNSRLL